MRRLRPAGDGRLYCRVDSIDTDVWTATYATSISDHVPLHRIASL